MAAELEPHPQHAVVFAIVRAPASAIANVASVVRSVAVLSITHDAGKSVRFDIDQRIYPYGHTADAIIEGLAATIPRGATVMSQIDHVSVRPSDLDLLAQARSEHIPCRGHARTPRSRCGCTAFLSRSSASG